MSLLWVNVSVPKSRRFVPVDLPQDVALLRESLEAYGITGDMVNINNWDSDIEYLPVDIVEPINIFELNRLAQKACDAAEAYGYNYWALLDAILEHENCPLNRAIKLIEDKKYKLAEDTTLYNFVEDLVSGGYFGEVPRSLIDFIDYEHLAELIGRASCFETDRGVLIRCNSVYCDDTLIQMTKSK